MKKEKTITLPEREWKRLRRVDDRQMKMKPLVLQLANFMREKKLVKK